MIEFLAEKESKKIKKSRTKTDNDLISSPKYVYFFNVKMQLSIF